MKLIFTTTFILLFCLNATAGETADSKASVASNKAEACSTCHNSMVSLKGRGVDVIISQTKAIQAAEKAHPPAGLKDLCDADIAEIAAFLDKK